MEKRFIYADNAATTPISESVFNAMLPYMKNQFGNPSSLYKLGRDSQAAVEKAREKCADALGCNREEIIFTSGGTESDNWAIRSAAEKLSKKGKNHIITSAFEHHAVLHTCAELEKKGFSVTYLPVSKDGFIDPLQVTEAITEKTSLVTIMYANNEIGTIQPINEIGMVCREKGVLFHTDAVQAVGHIPINLSELNVDMLSVSGHKLHAQKGIGLLYVKKGTALPNLLFGGGQERGKRPGTENVPGIVGLGTALSEAVKDIPQKNERISAIRNKIVDGLLKIEGSRLNGGLQNRLSGNINVSFLGVEGEALLLLLDSKGICASSGSACTSGSLDPSHVLLSLGLPYEVAHGSLRLSLGDDITENDDDYIISSVTEVVSKLRNMSPLWEDIINKNENIQKLLPYVSEIRS